MGLNSWSTLVQAVLQNPASFVMMLVVWILFSIGVWSTKRHPMNYLGPGAYLFFFPGWVWRQYGLEDFTSEGETE